MNKPNKFLCSWWKDGKWAKTVRFKKLSVLKKFLIRHREHTHIYLHIGSVPLDATPREMDMFIKDLSKMLEEKFNIKDEEGI